MSSGLHLPSAGAEVMHSKLPRYTSSLATVPSAGPPHLRGQCLENRMGWEAVASDRKFKLANVLKEKNLNSSIQKDDKKKHFPV